MVDKVSPRDPRIQYKTANLNGLTYSYILAEPTGRAVNTIFLIHGWPDLSLGWRYQIPLLTSVGFRVIAPNMVGYSDTDAPESPTYYTFKRVSDDLAELARQHGLSSIILGGHDWGGVVVYRFALHYPKLISAIFSVCTPFMPPRTAFKDMADLPNFKYQLQLRGPDVEANIVGKEKIRLFLNGIYGGHTPNGELPFTADHGCHFDKLADCVPTKLLSREELDFYAEKFAIHGMHGPLNWYRTQQLNFKDEKEIAQELEKGFQFTIPVLFVAGTRDVALPPSLARGMDKWFTNLTRAEVNANHWVLWEKPEEVNQILKAFLVGQTGAAKSSL